METIVLNSRTFIQTPNEFNSLLINAYTCLELLLDEYPDFDSWYFKKVISETKYGNRSIIVKQIKHEIAAIAILKNHSSEKKISTFRVIEKYQGIGIGTILMNEAMSTLNTTQPKITVSELRIEQFHKILDKFNFQLNSYNFDYYKKGVTEFSFNGPIEKTTPYNSKIPASRVSVLR